MKNSSSLPNLATVNKTNCVRFSCKKNFNSKRNSLQPVNFKLSQIPQIQLNPFMSLNQFYVKKICIHPYNHLDMNYFLNYSRTSFLSSHNQNLFNNSIKINRNNNLNKNAEKFKNETEICLFPVVYNINYFKMIDSNHQFKAACHRKEEEKSSKFLFSKPINNPIIMKRDLIIEHPYFRNLGIETNEKRLMIPDISPKTIQKKQLKKSSQVSTIPKDHKIYNFEISHRKIHSKSKINSILLSTRNNLKRNNKTLKVFSHTKPAINSN